MRTAFSYIFSPKDLPSLLDLDLTIEVPTEKSVMKRLEDAADECVARASALELSRAS